MATFCDNPTQPTVVSKTHNSIKLKAPVSDLDSDRTYCAIIRNPSTDDVPVAGYEGADLDPFDGTELEDTGLTPSTTYTYVARAICSGDLLESSTITVTTNSA